MRTFGCHTSDSHRPGYSMLGILITLVCIIILFTISMSALNRAVTGEGSAMRGTVRSVQDQAALYGLYQSMIVSSHDHGGSRFVVPSIVSGSGDIGEDTTANLFSAMIALRYTTPENLIAANEYSGYVREMREYNYDAYDPSRSTHWDPNFKADLQRESHVSFAHMPLFGERFDRGWKANFEPRSLILGNRGPKDGIHDPNSYTVGRNQQWGGHALYGEGRIEFLNTFTPPGLTWERHGQSQQDNIFAMEDGASGRDAILSFTKSMMRDGPQLQWD